MRKLCKLFEVLLLLQPGNPIRHRLLLHVSPSDFIDQMTDLLGVLQLFTAICKK